ncbi:MAG: efflux RND transporter periplasmic adaptor subunit [Thiomargarita sp.]|nr:efflux RND transporter periplasmic adaptor subunit [Thiomargarita sp.]
MWQRLIFIIICGLLVGCQENEPSVFDAPKQPTLQLSIASVISQKVPRFYSATGYTYARRIKISSHQSGTIKKRLVDEGDIVKAGALLVVIDDAELLDTIEQAKSAVQSATIGLNDSQVDVKLAEKLRKSRAVSVEHLRKARVQLDLARSKLVQVKAELRRQQTKKPYYRLTSPILARVVKRWIEPGDLAVAGKPLLELEAIGELEFETALPVHWIKQINLKDKVKLKLHHSNATIVAKVSHIVRSANRMTQTCQIKLSLPKPLTAGLSGQVDFKISEKQHLLIPKSTLVKRAGVQGAFRLDKLNNVWFTPVKTERLWEQQWVVLSGLLVGERLVLQPPLGLRDGVGVKLVRK